MKNKFISAILSLSVILSLVTAFPVTVDAASSSGTCGENLTWRIADGELFIEGTGAMTPYDFDSETPEEQPPWATSRESIDFLTIDSGVTEIGDFAFSGFTRLTRVTIPDTVKVIGRQAFSGCTDLLQIKLGSSLQTISVRAFYGCTGLQQITLPDSTVSVGSNAFRDCTSLKAVSLNDGLKKLGAQAFQGCVKLGTAKLGGRIDKIDQAVFYQCTSLKSISIPDSVKSIENNSFRESGLTEVTIPDSVKSIGDNAFYKCTELKTAVIGKGVTEIGNHAFRECKALEIADFKGCSASIGSFAFYFCSALKRVSNFYNVTEIGQCGFYGCTSLKRIFVPKMLTDIGVCSFAACIQLERIEVDSGNTAYTSVDGNLFDKDITTIIQYAAGKKDDVYIIPDTVKNIEAYAFAYSSLKSLGVSKSIESIGTNAFLGSSGAPVYYEGTADEWETMSVSAVNEDLLANIIYNAPLYGAVSHCEKSGDTVTAEIKYAFGGGAECLAYIGLYDLNGALLEAVPADRAETEAVFDYQGDISGCTVKLFFWDSAEGMKPIGVTSSAAVQEEL